MESLVLRSEVSDIYEKVLRNERINAEEGLRLYRCHDILSIGFIAYTIRKRLHDRLAYYVVNFHINYSNVCFAGCPFCAFGKFPDEKGAFEYSVDECVEMAKRTYWERATETHIVGGLHPDLPFDYYLDLVYRLKEALPLARIKAFSAVEIQYFSEISRLSVREVLEKLIEAGLDSLPGGGAEVLSERLHRLIFPKKASPQQWLNVHRTAHELGLKTNATLLYGHIETPEEKVDHMVNLRQLQDETGGFQVFIPLAYHPENTKLGGHPTTGVMDLKEIAISRILLDNFPHIKAYWIGLGVKLAQVALSFGADDLDGTVVREKVFHMAGASSPQHLTETQLRHIIEEAGYLPVRRDTFYNPIDSDGESEF